MYSKYLFTLQEKLKTKLISYKQENDIDAIVSDLWNFIKNLIHILQNG